MPPNVLLFITDQQRWDTLGCTGRSPCRTDGALSPPAGMTSNLGARAALARPTVLEVFRDAGYDVAYSGKWHRGWGRGSRGAAQLRG